MNNKDHLVGDLLASAPPKPATINASTSPRVPPAIPGKHNFLTNKKTISSSENLATLGAPIWNFLLGFWVTWGSCWGQELAYWHIVCLQGRRSRCQGCQERQQGRYSLLPKRSLVFLLMLANYCSSPTPVFCIYVWI